MIYEIKKIFAKYTPKNINVMNTCLVLKGKKEEKKSVGGGW